MKVNSPAWDEDLGVCLKHEIPCLPCPQCLADQDPDVRARLSPLELASLDFERGTLEDFFGPDETWLIDRLER